MATINQINFRLGQAKKKLIKLNKETVATTTKIKKYETALKKAKAEEKAKVKPKMKVTKAAVKKQTAPVQKKKAAPVQKKKAAPKKKD
ncbi:MAG: hypothetical protein GX846_10560, partial [Deltaproteobacteria bacterium]|nr:hypothetical protein [Deltaproteobacteria bacterium]